MFDKILVALDRSERNQAVFDSAIALAKTTKAQLMILHVLSEDESDYLQLPAYAYHPLVEDRSYEVYQEKLAQHRQLGLDFLHALSDRATEEGIKTEYSQITGNPGRSICQLAKTWQADLILVGSRGLTGLQEMFLGSVSNYVTHHGPCSVLIVRTDSDNNSDLTSVEDELETTIQSN
ncbi:universal stress protein [Myxosarcina sp. GI1(2024)]